MQLDGARLAFTTDSFVVTPIFFPGGDIGKLAVHGTVNDLAMSGARPLYLSAAFILEEGLPMEDLRRVVAVDARRPRARRACHSSPAIPRWLNRGKGDKIFINTSGIGVVEHGRRHLRRPRARPGDKIMLSGYIGDHGMAIMSQREGLEFEGAIESDSRPAARAGGGHARLPGQDFPLPARPDARRRGHHVERNRRASRRGHVARRTGIPVRETVKGACEILGLDPLYVANEGKLVAIVSAG